MARLKQVLQFIGWPVACGILAALVFTQYQQLQRVNARLEQVIATPAPTTPPPISFADAIALSAPAVVSINARRVNVESVERTSEDQVNLYLGERTSLGSGIILDRRGFILTNLHVVDTLFDAFDTEVTLQDGRQIPATVVAWDKIHDLAVLHINMDDLTPIQVADSGSLMVGDIVFAIGYPRNIGQAVSQGIISALTHDTDGNISIIQTDAAINPGNSGGALINVRGQLIGINSSIFSESGNFEGIGFATPSNLAVPVLQEMVEEAISANSGYLGVITGDALNAQSSQLFFGVDHIRGMLVESVDEGGPAMRAGIKPGDVITRVSNSVISDAQNIMQEIRNKKPGDTVNVQVYRNGKTLNFPTILGFGQAIIIEL
jgi:serine protease DegS